MYALGLLCPYHCSPFCATTSTETDDFFGLPLLPPSSMIAPGSVMVNDFVSPLIPVVDLAANQTVSRYDKFEDLSVCRTSDEIGVTKVNYKESIYRLHVTLGIHKGLDIPFQAPSTHF